MRDAANLSAERAWVELAALPGIRSAVVQVTDVKGRSLFEAAHGQARPGVPMTLAHRFHVASVAKTMIATLTLQLAEEGAFGTAGIDARYGAFEVFAPQVMARLHRRDGISGADKITLRHFLTHTSGIRDAMEDDAKQIGGPAPGSLIGRLASPSGDPSRFWAPWAPSEPDNPEAGVINFFLGTGIADAPLGAPGERFHYSDTGFMLLGLLIEKLLGQPLGEALFQRIFSPLGLRDTYLAYRRDPPDLGPKRAPEADFWGGALPLLESGASLSFDWGGGGVVSSAASLNIFLRALLAGELFTSRASLQAMLAWTTPPGLAAPRRGVGLGIFRTELNGLELIGHSGASGAKMFYAPRHEFFLSGTINQAEGPATWHWPIASCFAQHTQGDTHA